MFSDKEMKAYRGIKAPEELYRSIVGTKRKERNTLRIITALAACLVLIVTSVFIFKGKSNIIVNGQPLDGRIVFYDTATAKARSVSSAISVPIEIKAEGKTEISVLHGHVLVDGNEPSKDITISSAETLRWEITPTDGDDVYEMRITDKKGTSIISLRYNDTKITVTKEKAK